MLDSEVKEQLRSVFTALENKINLVYISSSHPDQSQLVEMLQDLSTTTPQIQVFQNPDSISHPSPEPQFHIEINGQPNGISFRGIPGGHEFSSLVLAILNSDHKGKQPDPILTQRIQKLKGPIRLKTYISLSCENCPDVVQALNQMATLHKDFHHEMIDGAYTPEDIRQLGIQGVPSVISGETLIHSGRIQFLDLLQKLEMTFGINEEQITLVPKDLGLFDVVIVGGGPSGVSAAIYSVRKGLKTALITDRMGGQVQDTKGIENLISVVYTEGPQLAHQLRQHLAAYPVQLFEHRRLQTLTLESEKKITLDSGEFLSAKAIIIATGAQWRELGIPGEKEYIGRGVAFCPHCDGPYYKGKKVAVVGGGNSGVEAAIDLAGIVREVILVEFQDQLKADKVLVDKLKSLPNVSMMTSTKTTQVLGDGTKVTQLEYLNRNTQEINNINLDGVFVQIGLLPNSSFLKGLVEMTSFGEIVVDLKGRTSAQGIYAAGDVTTTPYKQIIIAMGEGAKVALAAYEDLIHRQAY